MIRVVALAAALAGLAMASPAWACRCKEPTAAAAVAASKMAIVGTVASVRQVGPNAFDYEVVAEQAWGAARLGKVIVRSQGMCRFEMKKDARYLLFLQPTPPGVIQTSICMGNKGAGDMARTVSLLEARGSTEPKAANAAKPCS